MWRSAGIDRRSVLEREYNMKMEFDATIQKHGTIDGAYVELPFDPVEVFGAKRVKVLAAFDGEPYRGSVVTMGGCTLIGIPQAIRKKIGKNPGDVCRVRLEKDEAKREVALADDVKALLSENPDAKSFYETLSYTNQKRFIGWIEEAKTEATREKRKDKTIEMLKEKQVR